MTLTAHCPWLHISALRNAFGGDDLRTDRRERWREYAMRCWSLGAVSKSVRPSVQVSSATDMSPADASHHVYVIYWPLSADEKDICGRAERPDRTRRRSVISNYRSINVRPRRLIDETMWRRVAAAVHL